MTSNKIGRPPRKDYDADSILRNQIAIVRAVYDSCQEIKATAAELNLAELKVRKLLITGNIISYEQTDTIKDLQREGKTIQTQTQKGQVMTEIALSIINKDNLLYGSTNEPVKATGPACVDRKGEDPGIVSAKPTDAPILAVREK